MKKFAKSILAFSLGLSLVGTSFASLDVSNNSNSVVATYNGQAVLVSDIRPYLKGSNNGVYSDEAVKNAVKAYVVTQLKTEWEAKARASISVTEAEIDNVLYSEAARNGLTYSDFVRALAYQGYSLQQVRSQIRNGLYQQKMNEFLSQNVQTQIDRDAIQFEGYKNYQIALAENNLAQVDTYNVSYIFIQTTPLFSSEQAKAKALDIYRQINRNQITFAKAAQEYSDDIISAANDGLLGNVDTIKNDQERYVISQTVDRMKVGQISAPVDLGTGWAIIKYNAKEKIDATLNDYVEAAFQQTLRSRYNSNTTLEQFLLNSVVINYVFEQ
ncbi:hypothetical protein CJP74_02845 [Psittacicella melopsittaci]|uniref:peptidylprolyl isomerase n=1 Tax=Psittacicella melopsittaci TaxID=2028576 RepID=A0A3A1Y725_9GAMM|nr:peptidylprolyl isomerase [Psittacicella melopsittaci]RIY33080.1 hypothetical protein CJP74_02845 [Psittacicella melopsittaci]